MKNNLVSIFVSFLLSNFIFSQEREARILFLDSTSIKGFAEIKKERIYFRVDQDSELTEWDFEMVKGLLFEGYGYSEEYEYVKPSEKSKPVLMEVLERGNVNLYRNSSYGLKMGVRFTAGKNGVGVGPVGDYISAEDFYLKRSNEIIATDFSQNFKKKAMEYFSDCKAIVEKIEKKEFKRNTIPDMVFYYNDYCGKEYDD